MARETLRLGTAYILDWVVVIILAAAGGVLNYITGFHRPFSLADPAITYPDKKDIISIPVVLIVALVAPAAIIIVSSLIPHYSAQRNSPASGGSSKRWAQYTWEAHAGVLGLCLALAATLFITSGLKDMVGKPRPNLLARCQPNLDAIAKYLVGGLGNSLNSEAEALVNDGICQQTNRRILDDSFAAFPSGHSSFSSAGMIYLSLWLCMRFSVVIPYLERGETRTRQRNTLQKPSSHGKAAPPVWQVAIALVPIVVALFISSSRYADFHHAGFDIIAGMALGTVIAWTSFRLYHPPMRRSQGLRAWHARDMSNAFFTRSAGGDRAYVDAERDHVGETVANERRDLGMELDGLRPTGEGTENSDDPILPVPQDGANHQNVRPTGDIENNSAVKR